MGNTINRLLVDSDGAPLDRPGGFETEYGLWTRWTKDTPPKQPEYGTAKELMDDGSDSRYKENGNREYEDCRHPEISTAEDIDFITSAYRVSHGHHRLAELSAKNALKKQYMDKKLEVRLTANTVDITGQSWSSHQNELASRQLKPDDFIQPLAGHHASRIVWSGAGHILPINGGNEFMYCLSEKAEHIWQIANYDSTSNRPLVNLREEALADNARWRRLHDVSGETVFSPFANAMRRASESILLRAIELGVDFSNLELASPVKAMRQISRGANLQLAVPLADGRKYRGVDMQRAYAERSLTAASDAGYLTEQEKSWGEKWYDLNDDLAKDPTRCMRKVDWIKKQERIDKAIEKGGTKQEVCARAQARALGFHMLLPQEGAGMTLLRNGYFECSPSEEILQNGPGLPETRAKVRGSTIGFLQRRDIGYYADWERIDIYQDDDGRKFKLDDPFQTEYPELEEYLAKIAA